MSLSQEEMDEPDDFLMLDITSIESAIEQFDFSWQGRLGYGDSNKSF
jgi:hypothetical protein